MPNKKTLLEKVNLSAEGKLKDGNSCQLLLRDYLKSASLDELAADLQESLGSTGANSAFIFQDIVNELGARIGFSVTNGRYRGVIDSIGYDGLWEVGGSRLVVEAKKNAIYNVDLNVAVRYAREIDRWSHENPGVRARTGVLYVICRNYAHVVDNQIHGALYSDSVNVVSVESLLDCARLVGTHTDSNAAQALRCILFPQRFRSTDSLVSLVQLATGRTAMPPASHQSYSVSNDVAWTVNPSTLAEAIISSSNAPGKNVHIASHGNTKVLALSPSGFMWQTSLKHYDIPLSKLSSLRKKDRGQYLLAFRNANQAAYLTFDELVQQIPEMLNLRKKRRLIYSIKILWQGNGPRLVTNKKNVYLPLQKVELQDD